MNVSGFELIQPIQSVGCQNGFCGSITPLCFAGISPSCARNRTKSGWYHFSFGEHVCQECFDFLCQKRKKLSNPSVWHHRFSLWQKEWVHKSRCPSGKRHVPSTADFLAAQLLPWWLKCTECGQWRQLSPQASVGHPDSVYHPSRFHCKTVNKLSQSPCSWPLDERTTIVVKKPQDFLGSMKVHAWLQASPGLSVLYKYGLDLVGLSPDVVPGSLDEENANVDEPTSNKEASFVFRRDGLGSFSPIDMHAWERLCFPDMSRFPTVYLAVRNMILSLWSSDPKRLLTPWTVSSTCFIRGLLRIVICERWIPRILDEFTSRGLINIGVCRPLKEEPVGHVSSSNSSQEPHNVKFGVYVAGRVDLTNAMTVSQLHNGLSVRSRSRATVDEFEIKFGPFAHGRSDSATDQLDPLAILQLECDQPPRDESGEPQQTSGTESAGMERPLCCLKVCTTADNVIKSDRLAVPCHGWTDRIYLHDNHPLASLVAQSNLQLRPVDPCLLLFADPHATPTLVPVSDERRIRLEFHVEAVLGMVTQLCDSDAVTFDEEKWLTRSVQDSWDYLNSTLRDRLQDLDESPLEKRLIEFYLASVEFDLTEPLTVNFGSNSSRSHPTARLDQLPTRRYAEFIVDPTSSSDALAADASWCPPHEIVGFDGARGVFPRLCHDLVSHAAANTALESGSSITSLHVSLATSDKSLVFNGDTPTDFRLQSPRLSLHFEDGTKCSLNSMVFLHPIPTFRIVFDGSPAPQSPPASQQPDSVSLHLPDTLKPLLIEESTSEQCTSDHNGLMNVDVDETRWVARLITVTLVYARPWWREKLADLGADMSSASGSDGALRGAHQFAILPADRANRGFCHIFRDMFPKLNSPGVIQTQIFAAAADHLWSQTDQELSQMVHDYLRVSLVHSGTASAPTSVEPPLLLTSHVARLEHRPPGTKTTPHATDECGKSITLKPDAWDQLARYCQIIVPSRLSNPYRQDCPDTDAPPTSLGTDKFSQDVLGMDVATTAVSSGLRLAELVLRSMASCPTSAMHPLSEGEMPVTDAPTPDALIGRDSVPSEDRATKRLLKRKHAEDVDMAARLA